MAIGAGAATNGGVATDGGASVTTTVAVELVGIAETIDDKTEGSTTSGAKDANATASSTAIGTSAACGLVGDPAELVGNGPLIASDSSAMAMSTAAGRSDASGGGPALAVTVTVATGGGIGGTKAMADGTSRCVTVAGGAANDVGVASGGVAEGTGVTDTASAAEDDIVVVGIAATIDDIKAGSTASGVNDASLAAICAGPGTSDASGLENEFPAALNGSGP